MSRFSFEENEDPFAAVPSSNPLPPPPQHQQYLPPHPGSSNRPFDAPRAVRRKSIERNLDNSPQGYGQADNTVSPPVPIHRDPQGRSWGSGAGYPTSMASTTTPGADNFGVQAAGGISAIALSVADANARESGLEAMRNTPGYDQLYGPHSPAASPRGYDRAELLSGGEHEYMHPPPRLDGSQSSLTPLGAAAIPPAVTRSPHSYQEYSDNPYNRYSRTLDPHMVDFDPNSIEDDGDDGLEYTARNRASVQNLAQNGSRSSIVPTGAAAAGAAGGGGVMGTLSGLVGRTPSNNTLQYNPLANPHTPYAAGNYELGAPPEKSEWLQRQSSSRKRWKWVIATTVIFLIIGGIVAGVAVPLINKKNNPSQTPSSSVGGDSATTDTNKNGDLDKNSPEIKALMGNKDLHKVFPGMDYTPINTQYPDCLINPPSQNNITRDLAVLSQLTNIIRLYGTDCNQTEMLLHSIDQLGLNGTVKVWLGVWQDNNATTNARQLSQMYKVLAAYGTSPFLGVIIGNEVLFQQFMTETALETIIRNVRANFTSLKYNLPIATSDLGDSWTTTLAASVDYVMANVHPFFAGVDVTTAASWTNSFFARADLPLKTDTTKVLISETGWPSDGGMDCGAATSCTNGAVAGISQMNQFMTDWVCPALTNGSNYFWFEAFDEPWKIRYDTPGKAWEDKWGLMDVDRNLKSGLVIPSCGGKTVGPA